jgi:hypothetical protein
LERRRRRRWRRRRRKAGDGRQARRCPTRWPLSRHPRPIILARAFIPGIGLLGCESAPREPVGVFSGSVVGNMKPAWRKRRGLDSRGGSGTALEGAKPTRLLAPVQIRRERSSSPRSAPSSQALRLLLSLIYSSRSFVPPSAHHQPTASPPSTHPRPRSLAPKLAADLLPSWLPRPRATRRDRLRIFRPEEIPLTY